MAIIKWKTIEDIELEEFEQSLIPPKEEIDKANRELETIDLLIELELLI